MRFCSQSLKFAPVGLRLIGRDALVTSVDPMKRYGFDSPPAGAIVSVVVDPDDDDEDCALASSGSNAAAATNVAATKLLFKKLMALREHEHTSCHGPFPASYRRSPVSHGYRREAAQPSWHRRPRRSAIGDKLTSSR
jgi:hypothetical protein